MAEAIDRIDATQMSMTDLALEERRKASERKILEAVKRAKPKGAKSASVVLGPEGAVVEPVVKEKESLEARQARVKRKAKEFVLDNVDDYLAELKRVATSAKAPVTAKLKAIEVQMQLAGIVKEGKGVGGDESGIGKGDGCWITAEEMAKIRADCAARGVYYPFAGRVS